MKARLFVVDEDTLKEAKESKIAKIRIPTGSDENENHKKVKNYKKPSPKFVQSINSMLADFLQLSVGDYVFFWCEKKNDSQGSTISGVYRVISKPFFRFDNEEDLFPFKVHIEEAYKFGNPIIEYEVLNSPFIHNHLWNITGKKISGKSRGSIQITPEESEVLIQLLIDKNEKYEFIPEDEKRYCHDDDSNRLIFRYEKSNDKTPNPAENHIHEFNIGEIKHFSESGTLYYEKSFEALFNFEINEGNRDCLKQIGIKDDEKVIWFGNYLPYSLDATEMDYLIFTSIDGSNITGAYVIEFKIGRLPLPTSDTHFNRAMKYSKWVDEYLLNGANITQPILICEKCPDFNNPTNREINFVNFYNELEKRCNHFGVDKRVRIYAFDYSGNKIIFAKKR